MIAATINNRIVQPRARIARARASPLSRYDFFSREINYAAIVCRLARGDIEDARRDRRCRFPLNVAQIEFHQAHVRAAASGDNLRNEGGFRPCTPVEGTKRKAGDDSGAARWKGAVEPMPTLFQLSRSKLRGRSDPRYKGVNCWPSLREIKQGGDQTSALSLRPSYPFGSYLVRRTFDRDRIRFADFTHGTTIPGTTRKSPRLRFPIVSPRLISARSRGVIYLARDDCFRAKYAVCIIDERRALASALSPVLTL